jgi:hypothetical protein
VGQLIGFLRALVYQQLFSIPAKAACEIWEREQYLRWFCGGTLAFWVVRSEKATIHPPHLLAQIFSFSTHRAPPPKVCALQI